MYIKYIMLVCSLFVVLGSSMYAQSNTEENDVKILVEKVKKAAPSQRRLLMNELKIKLRSMQRETRRQVMLGLRSAFNAQHTQQHMQMDAMKSGMNHQGTMSMTEAKHMQEHMNMESMTKPQRPPQEQRPENHTPNRGTAGVQPQSSRPTHNQPMSKPRM